MADTSIPSNHAMDKLDALDIDPTTKGALKGITLIVGGVLEAFTAADPEAKELLMGFLDLIEIGSELSGERQAAGFAAAIDAVTDIVRGSEADPTS